MKRKRLVLWLFITGVITFLGYKIINAFIDNDRAFEEQLPPEYSLTGSDSTVFAAKHREKIKVNQVLRSKVRNPISLITVDEKYSLILYKIGESNLTLKEAINLQMKSVDRSTGHTYSVVDNNLFRFQYKAGAPSFKDKIYFTLAGDSIQNLHENDSTIAYRLLCKNLSVRYSQEDPVDLFMEVDKKPFNIDKAPMDVLFLQKSSTIYFLLLAPNEVNSSFPSNLLYNIVTDN